MAEQCDVTLTLCHRLLSTYFCQHSNQWREWIILMPHPWPQLELKLWSTPIPCVGTRGATMQSRLGTSRLRWNTIVSSIPLSRRSTKSSRQQKIWKLQYSATTMIPKINYRRLSTCEISSQEIARQSVNKTQSIKLNPPCSGTWNLSILLNLRRLSVILSHKLLSHNLYMLTIMYMHQRSCPIRRMKKPTYDTGTTYYRGPI